MAASETTPRQQIDWSELSSGTNSSQAKWQRLLPRGEKLVQGVKNLLSSKAAMTKPGAEGQPGSKKTPEQP